MSDIGALVERLVAQGISVGEASEVIALACAAGAATATYRKSPGAIRTARWRAKRHEPSHGDGEGEASRSVTKRHEASQCDTPSLSIEKKEEVKERKREGKRASQLPSDWRPDAEGWAYAVSMVGESRAENELAKFKDHALAKGRTAKDWPAAWRNWIRRAVEFSGAGPPGGKPMTEFQRKQAATQDVLDDLRIARLRTASGREADQVLSGDQRSGPEGVRSGAGSTVLALPEIVGGRGA